MKVISFCSFKGGTGKTTTVINLAAIFAAREYDLRVLVIDADPQANATSFLSATDATVPSLSDLMSNPCARTRQSVISARQRAPLADPGSTVDVISANTDLLQFDLAAFMDGRTSYTTIQEIISSIDDLYDLCLIDCPPAFTAATAAAIWASDLVIVPTKLDKFSLDGVMTVQEQIDNLHAAGSKVRFGGVVITQTAKSNITTMVTKLMDNLGIYRYPSIRRTVKVDESLWGGVPLIDMDGNITAKDDYKALAKEIYKEVR